MEKKYHSNVFSASFSFTKTKHLFFPCGEKYDLHREI